MLKLFAKYTSIGAINTLIHWVVFAVCKHASHTGQALWKFAGFVVMSFIFFGNAKFTFKSFTTIMRYMLYIWSKISLSVAGGLAILRGEQSKAIILTSQQFPLIRKLLNVNTLKNSFIL